MHKRTDAIDNVVTVTSNQGVIQAELFDIGTSPPSSIRMLDHKCLLMSSFSSSIFAPVIMATCSMPSSIMSMQADNIAGRIVLETRPYMLHLAVCPPAQCPGICGM